MIVFVFVFPHFFIRSFLEYNLDYLICENISPIDRLFVLSFHFQNFQRTNEVNECKFNRTDREKRCVIFNKSGGILICDGCQKNFCGKHVLEHRQELTLKLDQLMQDDNLLHHDLNEIES